MDCFLLIHKSPHPYYPGCKDSPVCSLPRYTLAVNQKYKYNYFFRIKMKLLFIGNRAWQYPQCWFPSPKKYPLCNISVDMMG